MTKKTLDMLDIGNPDLNFVELSQGMGVKATRVTTIEDFNSVYASAMTTSGPQLIEVVLP
jgi:acetolactate synthase-1/2/3 large subunit